MKGIVGQYRILVERGRSVGWPTALRLRSYDLWHKLSLPVGRTVGFQPRNSAHPVKMRTGASSDRDVFHQIFVFEEYKDIQLDQPKLIVDLGANVGYSSAYFLAKFPTAQVVSLEPEATNWQMCMENLKAFGARAKVIHGAIWPERTQLSVRTGEFGDGREWATQVRPASGDTSAAEMVPAYDLPAILDLCPTKEIDLLKVDIEGSEEQLFSRGAEKWLPHVRNICIELHNDACKRAFKAALHDYEYESSVSGELTICTNLSPRPVGAKHLQ